MGCIFFNMSRSAVASLSYLRRRLISSRSGVPLFLRPCRERPLGVLSIPRSTGSSGISGFPSYPRGPSSPCQSPRGFGRLKLESLRAPHLASLLFIMGSSDYYISLLTVLTTQGYSRLTTLSHSLLSMSIIRSVNGQGKYHGYCA